MKYLSYEGLQYLYSKILTRLGLKVDATGGDISETVIETLDTVEDKYPVPAAGESVKRFFGKALTFLKNIRPLTGDINVYVSTTGSDITGDGTQSNPFKTIQYAIDILPKDLNGYTASIIVASGTYAEDLNVINFGNSGFLMLLLSGNVTVGHVMLSGSFLIINSTGGVRSLSVTSLTVMNGSNLNSWGEINITTTGKRTISTVGDNYSIIVIRGSTAYISGVISITGNTYLGFRVHSLSRVFLNSLSGSGLTTGVAVETGSMFTYLYVNISATTKFYHDSGGMLINANGTQISDDITTGLSCTWGTIRSGYVRHGNINGAAMISINCRIDLTANLTANMPYTITGFPIPAISAFGTASVAVDSIAKTTLCSLERTGVITFVPSVNVTAGSWSFTFSVTYKTNS